MEKLPPLAPPCTGGETNREKALQYNNVAHPPPV